MCRIQSWGYKFGSQDFEFRVLGFGLSFEGMFRIQGIQQLEVWVSGTEVIMRKLVHGGAKG